MQIGSCPIPAGTSFATGGTSDSDWLYGQRKRGATPSVCYSGRFPEEKYMTQAKSGDKVRIHYTGTLELSNCVPSFTVCAAPGHSAIGPLKFA